MNTASRSLTVYGEISLFDIPLYLRGSYTDAGQDSLVSFSVRVGDKTLGEVLRYVLALVGVPNLRLDPPWNVIENIRLNQFVFEIEIRNGVSRYGFSYADLGLDLAFLQIDRVSVFYTPRSPEVQNQSVDVNVFGSFLGVDFTKEPISWDAMKEQPPSTLAGSDKTFKLDYLGLGQRVTLRDISDLTTIGKVIDALRNSYVALNGDETDPLKKLPSLTYDESAAWLVGAKFTVLETLDFSGVWNLPALAGARIALKGDRAKSLAGFEFEILYRRIAEDLGQYHIELALPDVLRRFQAGIASVTLPIIDIDIYTDGGFKIDLGFPRSMDFSRSFSIEMVVLGIPVTGALGVYFGVLSAKAVPDVPAITGGSFSPVIVAGAGLRLGIGKSLKAGILEAGFFIGIETVVEGILGFYQPLEDSEPKATYFRLYGKVQLTGHIYGKVNFAIISAEVDIYAYISVSATFEVYRATLLVFEAGVKLKLTVKINLGLFKISIGLSFSVTIREQILLGEDSPTPWQIADDVNGTLASRIGTVAYRRLPDGQIIADATFALLLDPDFDVAAAFARRSKAEGTPRLLQVTDTAETIEMYFRPITTLGLKGDHPGGTVEEAGQVNLVATLMLRLNRSDHEILSPAELYVREVFRWGLGLVRGHVWAAGGRLEEATVSLSELTYLMDHLDGEDPPIVVMPDDVRGFFTDRVSPQVKAADWQEKPSLTPFPIIPYLTLSAGVGENVAYRFDFGAEPLCSPAYQENIRKYFDQLDQMRDQLPDVEPSLAHVIRGEDLSMSELIFFDAFKLVLRGVVTEAIGTLREVAEPAQGRTLRQIAVDVGMDNIAARRQIEQANVENAAFFAPLSPVAIARDGVLLRGSPRLDQLANTLGVPLLQAAQAVQTQPILDPETPLVLSGVCHLLKPDDTRDKILQTYGIADWEEVLDANPALNWRVPPPAEGYPTLELPAGQTILLPPITLPADPDRTLAGLVASYGLTLSDLVEQHPDLPFRTTGLARAGLQTNVLQGETIAALATRVGLPAPADLAATLLDNRSILQTGSTLSVPAGQHIIARGETAHSIAAERQITVAELSAANADAPWKFIPRPNSALPLPMGVTLTLPAVPQYRIAQNDTLQTIAGRFGLEPLALANHNADTLALATLAEVVLPVWSITLTETPPPPAEIAQTHAVAPVALIRANQGATDGPGSDTVLGTLLIPNCEKITEDRLIELMAAGGEDGKLAQTAKSMARMLMSGLRLPDPEGPASTCVPDINEPLYPLYQLSGQQWPAPIPPSTDYWVELAWNDTGHARQLFAAQVNPGAVPEPVRVNLTADDVTLINGFGTAVSDPAGLQPKLLAQTSYPGLEQVRAEQALGTATPWAVPTPITFSTEAGSPEISPYFHDIPRGLRDMLPTAGLPLAPLIVSVIESDPVIGQDIRRELHNVGWATRLDLQIRQAFGGEEDDTLLPSTYEVLSIDAQGQADLEGLRNFIYDGPGGPFDQVIDLYLLYPASALSAVSQSLRSDDFSAAARAKVALLKSNLSTFSQPASGFTQWQRTQALETLPKASATMNDGLAFLDLLWQVSVTNGGGFFLDYGIGQDGPGLPESVFEDAEVATVSVLVVLRPSAENPATIAPARFHNVLVSAENLPSATETLVVTAQDGVVTQEPESDPPVSASLGRIAVNHGLDAGTLSLINASTPNLLMVGRVVTLPDDVTYTVQIGDDLLTVALAVNLEITALGEAIKDQVDLLRLNAPLFIRPGWVTARNRVQPQLGGFRVLRAAPVEPSGPGGDEDPITDFDFRIQSLFQLMGYGLAESEVFAASTQGLPIIPDDPDQGAERGRFALEEGDPQPWVYQRLLPLSPFAEKGRFPHLPMTDPYGGIGHAAAVALTFQDVFGNRLPRPNGPLSVEWNQLYRDPLIPLHAWPSVTLAYDVHYEAQMHAPQIRTRVKFAPAGYAAEIGMTNARLRSKLNADQKRYALAYYQVVDARVDLEMRTTLNPTRTAPIDSDRVARFARDIYTYLGALAALKPTRVPADDASTLAGLAEPYSLLPEELAEHIARVPNLLRPNTQMAIPERLTVLPDMSLNDIVDQTGGVTPAKIGTLNQDVPLTSGVILVVAGHDVKTVAGDTLAVVAGTKMSVGELSADNAGVRGLFRQGSELYLGERQIKVAKHATLQAIANDEAVRLEDLARANADRALFAEGAKIEIPLHMTIPAGTDMIATVGKKQSLGAFVKEHGASTRDVLTANSATTGLLRPGAKVWFKPDRTKGKERAEVVTDTDTLATITLRFARAFDDPSLMAADVGAYSKNVDNDGLLVDGALALLPPIRFGVTLDVPRSITRDVIIVELGVDIAIQRNNDALIDPSFLRAPEVEQVVSKVSPRLSSQFSADERSSLLAFAQQFQKTFDTLKLAVGPDTVQSVGRTDSGDTSDIPAKLIAVKWDPHMLDAVVSGPAAFFAPRPLLNVLWDGKAVPIYPYIPGQPIYPLPEEAATAGAPVATEFNAVDLERWAETLLRRIDRILKPDLIVPLNIMAPDAIQKIVQSKQDIAEAVAASVQLVLKTDSSGTTSDPDPVSAGEQLKQQLLTELGPTYRGSTVVQYNVDAVAPKDKWSPELAPRFLCQFAPVLTKIPTNDPTLIGLAGQLGGGVQLVADLIRHVQNILIVGRVVDVGTKPKITETDTLDSLAKDAEVPFADLVAAIENERGILRPGAGVPIAKRAAVSEPDSSFATLIEKLAPNLVSRGQLDRAFGDFFDLNGETKGVFEPGIQVHWPADDPDAPFVVTKATDTIAGLTAELGADPIEFIDAYYVTTPLVADGQTFQFIARIPPSTISAGKISFFESDTVPNKLNTVFVTSAPDEASSVTLGLKFAVQAMEYNVHEATEGHGYLASDWLTFVDWNHGQDLGEVEIPVPNRQFPLPPSVLSHDVAPHVKDGSVDPGNLQEIMLYDYHLHFAFDAAAQDEMFYTQYDMDEIRNLSRTVPAARDTVLEENPPANLNLAQILAQYQSIDIALWEDIFRLRGHSDTPLPDQEAQIVAQALRNFAVLAEAAGQKWSEWLTREVAAPGGDFRIRRHAHPDGRTQLTVAPTVSTLKGAGGKRARRTPSARVLGRSHHILRAGNLTHTLMQTPEPVPRTRRGEYYAVEDPDLNLLEQQRCWGGISVTRNRGLVDGRETDAPFVLHIPDVRAVNYLTPAFTITQKLLVGTEIGPLKDRLARLFEAVLFPALAPPVPSQQRISVTAAFARPLAWGGSGGDSEPQPMDETTLFAPVVTTPMIWVSEADDPQPDPQKLADRLATHLAEFLKARGLAPRTEWAMTLKLFSGAKDEVSPPVLLEVLDLRFRMADQ